MNLTRRLRQRQSLVDNALNRLLRPRAGAPGRFHEAMRYGVLGGGKRYRPLLCIGAAEAVGAGPGRVMQVACALELIHAYSLVHDDLPAMDNADERRGQPSCHKRFGEATAILVGDALLTRAFELLAASDEARRVAVIRAVAHAAGTTGLIGGQVLDLNHQRQPGTRVVAALEDIARRKTAALITVSVVAGGIAAGASTAQHSRLQRYGQRIGLAFQLTDDANDGDGLAAVSGRDAVRRQAAALIGSAHKDLDAFKQRAWLLHELADWLASS